ncbi:odorant receptor 129-1 [Myripristis murdjan]|uniref:odorant receptor 129-1 n=1 Tax=Myripristis murdjan TaxID=586833 RepID=UPI001175F91E|nr:odorant receptor 131-2-like [Myripristis murdjan]
MQNLSELPGNATSHRSMSGIVKVCVVIPFFCVFLYWIVLMLHVFASHRQFLESSRYILFAYMLINDTIQLFSSVLLFLLAINKVQFAIVFCAPLLFLSVATFQNTPLILATMSLERYVSIFYPLQRPAAWHADHIWVIILSLWLISCVLPLAELCLGEPNLAVDVLSTPMLCKAVVLYPSPTQTLVRVSLNCLFFSVVAVIIFFTYLRILVETKKLRQGKESASKAMHTVLLHGFQLLLCMMAFTHPITVSLIVLHADWQPEDIAFFNYFCFILIPRFLSPLIYGLRDESLRGYMRRAVFCCLHRATVRASDKLQVNTSRALTG